MIFLKNMKEKNKLIETTLQLLKDEIKGDVKNALQKMHPKYSMTWVYKTSKGILFPSVDFRTIKKAMKDAYQIKGRQYEIKNIAEGDNVVMVEMIESYPDQDTKEVYRTPLVVVLEFEKGEVITGRHYCDPKLSYESLTVKGVSKAFKNKRKSQTLK